MDTAITDMKGCSVDVDIPVNGHYFEMYMLLSAYYQVLLLFYIYILGLLRHVTKAILQGWLTSMLTRLPLVCKFFVLPVALLNGLIINLFMITFCYKQCY